MSLIPYKVTAIKRVDTNGVNILANASVSITVTGGGFASLFDDEAGTIVRANPFTVDANGEREVWLAGGKYNVSVSGGQSWDIKLSGGTDVTVVDKYADLATTPALFVNQIVKIARHTSGTIGGGDFIAVSGSVTNDGGTQINSATVGVYWKRMRTEDLTLYDFGCPASGSGVTAMDLYLASAIEKIKVPNGVTLGSHTFSATKKIIIGGNAITFTTGLANAGFRPLNVEYLEITGFTNVVMSSTIADGHQFFSPASGAVHGVIKIYGNSGGGGIGGVVASYEGGRSFRELFILDNDFNDPVGEVGGTGYGVQFANENLNGECWIERNNVTRAGRHSYYIARNAGGTIHFNNNKAIDHRENSTVTRGSIRPAMFFARSRNIVGFGNEVHGYYDGAMGFEWENEVPALIPGSPLPIENVGISMTRIKNPKNTIEAISYGLSSPSGSLVNGITLRGVDYYCNGQAAALINFNYGKNLKISDIYAHYLNMSTSFNIIVLNANSATDSTGHIVDGIQVAVENSASATLNVFRIQNGSATAQIRTKLRNVTVRSDAGTNNTFSSAVSIDNALIQLNGAPDDGLTFSSGVYLARTPNPSISLNIRTISTVITTPIPSVTPRYLHEEIYLSDPGAKSYWRANGLTTSDWVKLGP